MPRVALYDRNCKPPSWMDLIRPGQYAAFFRDIDTGAEVTEAGVPLCSGESRSCVIFDSFPEVSDYCQPKVSQVSALRCDVFDSQGRVNAPVASFVNRAHSHKLDSPEKFRRMILIGFVPIAVSLPLFLVYLESRRRYVARRVFRCSTRFVGSASSILGLQHAGRDRESKETVRTESPASCYRSKSLCRRSPCLTADYLLQIVVNGPGTAKAPTR
jgi:hypothetical protein